VKRYGVHDLAISQNYLGACSNDGKLRFFDLSNNISKVKFLKNECATKSMEISNNQEYIAYGDSKGTLKLHQMKNLYLMKEFKNLHETFINSVSFNQSNTKIATGSSDCYIKIVDLTSAQFNIETIGSFFYILIFRQSRRKRQPSGFPPQNR
jgi:WD40 repeat protein